MNFPLITNVDFPNEKYITSESILIFLFHAKMHLETNENVCVLK